MADIAHIMPDLEGEELTLVESLAAPMNEEQAQVFSSAYRAGRREPQTILVLSVVGLFTFPGLQRFFLGQTGLGFLYLFTGGLLLIGSIFDLANYKSLTLEYNRKAVERMATRILNTPTAEPR
jgi:TM2 domain-containing membrane protein YozV